MLLGSSSFYVYLDFPWWVARLLGITAKTAIHDLLPIQASLFSLAVLDPNSAVLAALSTTLLYLNTYDGVPSSLQVNAASPFQLFTLHHYGRQKLVSEAVGARASAAADLADNSLGLAVAHCCSEHAPQKGIEGMDVWLIPQIVQLRPKCFCKIKITTFRSSIQALREGSKTGSRGAGICPLEAACASIDRATSRQSCTVTGGLISVVHVGPQNEFFIVNIRIHLEPPVHNLYVLSRKKHCRRVAGPATVGTSSYDRIVRFLRLQRINRVY